MPNNYNFSELTNVKKITINPDGWINPIFIEYGLGYYQETLSYFWRVKDTKHTFIIPLLRMDFITNGNYVEHFKEALEGFREDYKGWAKKEWQTEWMQEYREQFSKFISL